MSKETLLYFAEHTSIIFKVENVGEALLQIKEYLEDEGSEATITITEEGKTITVGRAFINERGEHIIALR